LKRRPSLDLLLRYLRPHWRLATVLALLLGGSLALQLINPQVIRYFLDATQSGGTRDQLLNAALAYLLFALGQQGLGLGATLAGQQLAWRSTNALRYDLALHCLRLDQSFHKTHTPGEMIERLNGDVSQLAEFFSTFTLQVIANGLLVIGILALLFAADWRVGAALSVYVVLTLWVLAAAQKLTSSHWAAAHQSSAEASGFIEERLAGAEDIRAAGAMPYMLYRLQLLTRTWLQKFRLAIMLGGLVFNFTNLMSVAGYALGLALAVLLYTRHEVTIGTAYLIVAYAGMLSRPLHSLREQARQVQHAGGGIQRINALFEIKPQVGPPADTRPPLAAGALPAEFHQVSFAYDADEPVLRGVTFQARPGRVLGVLGRTGSGKTTLARLLFRFYDPDQGAVRLGGEDLRGLALDNLRARVGMVTQDVQLFQASIRDNLTFFDPHRDDAALWKALEALQLADWVRAQPKGLDTPLTTGGQGLSAGEAQLLAFTRVFLHDPGLVILDEASSRLDPATENRLERAIDRLLAGRTAILIAHRLQTVSRADDILILENGQVAEYGRREALAADPGSRFFQLLNTGLEAALA
jgi:ABC-type multidrug transport system fused ATPase/permease subunit